MVTIELGPLKKGVNQLTLRPSALSASVDPETFADIVVNAMVDVQSVRLVVRFEASAKATLTCDRTLKPFVQPVSGSYALLFSAGQDVVDTRGMDDVRTFSRSDRDIDITDALRDTLILSLPVRRIAPGADDEEIPTQFGADDGQIDPRWEALRGLQN